MRGHSQRVPSARSAHVTRPRLRVSRSRRSSAITRERSSRDPRYGWIASLAREPRSQRNHEKSWIFRDFAASEASTAGASRHSLVRICEPCSLSEQASLAELAKLAREASRARKCELVSSQLTARAGASIELGSSSKLEPVSQQPKTAELECAEARTELETRPRRALPDGSAQGRRVSERSERHKRVASIQAEGPESHYPERFSSRARPGAAECRDDEGRARSRTKTVQAEALP